MKTKFAMGVIAAGGLLLGGCAVEDAISDAFETNVIYVVNGTAGAIAVSVTSQGEKTVESKNLEAEAFILSGEPNYTVRYDGDHAKSFPHGSVYLYAATTCNNEGFLDDEVDGNRVHVVNLTGESFSDDITITDADGVVHTITDNAPACSVAVTAQADDVKIGNGMTVKIGDGDAEIISGIPDALVDKANSIKVDIVVYSTTEGTIVPMAGYDDLL